VDKGKQKILTPGYNQTAYPLINSTLKNKKQFDEFEAICSNIMVLHSSARLMAFKRGKIRRSSNSEELIDVFG